MRILRSPSASGGGLTLNDYWKYLNTAIEEYKEFPAWNKPKEFYELLNKFCNESKKFTESNPIGDNAPKNPHAGETKIGTTEFDVFNMLSLKRLRKNGIHE